MKFCPSCGKEYGDEKRFCGDCGVALATKAVEENAELQVASETKDQTEQTNAGCGEVKQTVQPQGAHKQLNIQLDVTKMQDIATKSCAAPKALLMEERIGQGVYAVATVGRLLVVTVLEALILWSWSSSLADLQNVDKLLQNGFSSLPSMTPFYLLMLLNFAFAAFLLFKRLKDMGQPLQVVKIGTGIYGAIALFSVYLLSLSVDKLYNLLIASMTRGIGGFLGTNPFQVAAAAASDIRLALELMFLVNIVAMVFAFFRGSAGKNEHGDKPTML